MKKFKINGMSDEQLALETSGLAVLYTALTEAKKAKKESDEFTAATFRTSPEGKKAIEEFFKKTHKASLKNEEDGDPEEVDESVAIKNLALLDSVLESMITFSSNLNESTGDDWFDSLQGKFSVKTYLQESSKLHAKNKLKKEEEDLEKETKNEDEEDVEDVLASLSDEEINALDSFISAIAASVTEAEDDPDTTEEMEDSDVKESKKKSKKESEDSDEDDEDSVHESIKKFIGTKSGREALKLFTESVSKSAFKISQNFDKKLNGIADIHSKALEEHVMTAMKSSKVLSLGTLNEAETNEVKSLVVEAVQEMAELTTKSMKDEMIAECEAYVATEVIPAITEKFDNEYVPMVQEEFMNSVQDYVTYSVKVLAEDMNDKKLIVKSHKYLQLEDFTTTLLRLMEEKLSIVPEQEDELERVLAKNARLRESVNEKEIEKVKMNKELFELRKANYVLANLPESLSAMKKEQLLGYVEDVLDECDSMPEFKKMFNEAVDSACAADKDSEEEMKEAKKRKKSKFESEDDDEDDMKESKKRKKSKFESEDDDEDEMKEAKKSKKESEDDDEDEMMERVLRAGGIRKESDDDDEDDMKEAKKRKKSKFESDDDDEDGEPKNEDDDSDEDDKKSFQEKVKRLGKYR